MNGLWEVKSFVEPSQVPASSVEAITTQRLSRRSHERYTEASRPGAAREKPKYLLPFVAAASTFTACTDCFANARSAVLERLFYHQVDGRTFTRPHTPTYDTVRGALSKFKQQICGLIQPTTPVDWADFPSKYYRGRRLCVYTNALENLLRTGLQRSHSHIQAFLKDEKLEIGVKRVVPRLIQPRRPEYNIVVGCYLRPIEHTIYQLIAKVCGGPTVMKGFNVYEIAQHARAAWGAFPNPVGIGLDAKRFDQHVNRPLLEWEHSIYSRFYPGDAQLQRVLHWQLHNKGVLRTRDGVIKYEIDGTRCSGDMNTALGNCLVMCGAVKSFADTVGVPIRLLNNGDDCMVILDASNIERFRRPLPRYFSKLGLVMKVEDPVFVFEHIVFCQTQPVYDGHVWRMVRDPHVSLSKDATLMNSTYATTGLSAQLKAIADCGLSLVSGLPVLQEYYLALRRGHEEGTGPIDPRFYDSGFYHLSRGLQATTSVVSPEARASFARAFNMLPDLQVALERQFSSLPILGVDGLSAFPGLRVLLK